MLKTIFLFSAFLFTGQLKAQTDSVEKIFAFRITDYIRPINDSFTVVQVLKPASMPVAIRDQQIGSMWHSFKTGTILDTSNIGWGRCQLIKSDYYYFGIHLMKMQAVAGGDLIYIKTNLPVVYDGLLINVMNHAMQFNNVYGQPFMNSNAIFTNTKKDEQDLLDSMINDIRFTGKAMLAQMPDNNQLINTGIYKGQKLFEAMQLAKRAELETFLKYIAARPKKYAGNDWKISEIFATWMTGGTPYI